MTLVRTGLGGVAVGIALAVGSAGCGNYQDLSATAHTVTATTSRPTGNCRVLGNLTGKGGGAGGGYVSNESLIEYAVNDLRNQAAELGATHVVYSTAGLGGTSGTTTSAMVMGEAMRCDEGEAPPAPAQRVVAAATSGGCEYDTQCKGDRVCVNHACVDPAPAAATTADGAAGVKP